MEILEILKNSENWENWENFENLENLKFPKILEALKIIKIAKKLEVLRASHDHAATRLVKIIKSQCCEIFEEWEVTNVPRKEHDPLTHCMTMPQGGW